MAESSFGAMAVEVDSMEDKLQLVQTKRRWVQLLASALPVSMHFVPVCCSTGMLPHRMLVLPAGDWTLRAACLLCFWFAACRSVLFTTIAGSGHSTPRSGRPSGAGAAVAAADAGDGQGSRIQEISEVLKEGPDSKRTLDTIKSMDRTLNRSLTNVGPSAHCLPNTLSCRRALLNCDCCFLLHSASLTLCCLLRALCAAAAGQAAGQPA
jgi:hypothetical protein